MYLLYFYKFLKKILMNFFINKNFLVKILKKKNLFFKKRNKEEVVLSKRLSIVLRKRKKTFNFKKKKIDNGNFFFKKFFFKTLLKNRKFFKNFFLLSSRCKQTRITKAIYRKSNFSVNPRDVTGEYSILNIILRSGLFFFFKDAMEFIKLGMVYINGKQTTNNDLFVNQGDCIQILLSTKFYKYVLYTKKLLKKKVAFFKYENWRFFRQNSFKKNQGLRLKKKKNPKYLHHFYFYKLGVPKFLEIDFITLSFFLIKKEDVFLQSSYYLTKPFSFKLFPLYNFKKIN